MARILVAGSRGLLGCDLVPQLVEFGHAVVSHAHTKFAQVSGDLADAAKVMRLLDDVAPTVIVNLAANTNVDDCEHHPQKAYMANVRIVENLASWIRVRESSCLLVHISTDQVYDGPILHSESDVTLTNYYAFSKYAGEIAAASVGAVVLRTNFFGPSHCEGRTSLSDWLVSSLRAGKAITVFDDVYFSPISISRLVIAIATVIENAVPGIYNLGSINGMSKAEFALSLAQALDLPTNRMTVGSSADAGLIAYRPKNMRMNSSHFQTTFGVALPTLADEISSMRRAYA